MAATKPLILTINGGSSSIKFALFDGSHVPQRILGGAIERNGPPQATLNTRGQKPADHVSQAVNAPRHAAAVDVLMDWIQQCLGGHALAAVGHSVVQGGPKYRAPQWITDALIEDVRRLFSFDPEHLREEVLPIEAFRHRLPDVPQVACFDTAFHHNRPRVATPPASPRRYEKHGVRRYGFHGLSYEFLMGELASQAGESQDVRAAEAVALFCYQVRKWIGAFAAALGGLATLVFAGGIGESAPVVRQPICDGLDFLGIELDAQRNPCHAPLMSTDTGRVQVRVISTDEEIVIAKSTARVLHLHRGIPTP